MVKTSEQQKKYKQLADKNQIEIEKYNLKMLSTLSLMGWVLLLLPLLATPFSYTKKDNIPIYLITILIYLTIFIGSKFSFFSKYSKIGIYISFSLLFIFAIYLSVIHSPNMRATIMLGALCLMPLSLIDHPYRINMFCGFWVLVHTILAAYFKPRYALDDTINCLCFGVLGCYIGDKVVQVRLESFEMHRLLILDRDTDALTKLNNRRKLFETLALLETKEIEKPTGIMMIDIDHFKLFNDTYGHAAGDRCLKIFGEEMLKFMQKNCIRFYRYGGEEFLAMLYGYSETEVLSIAETLRIVVEGINVDGRQITVSIGISYCGNEYIKNYEEVISKADNAVYSAKKNGRNMVCKI